MPPRALRGSGVPPAPGRPGSGLTVGTDPKIGAARLPLPRGPPHPLQPNSCASEVEVGLLKEALGLGATGEGGGEGLDQKWG